MLDEYFQGTKSSRTKEAEKQTGGDAVLKYLTPRIETFRKNTGCHVVK